MDIKQNLTDYLLVKPMNNASRSMAMEQQVQLNVHTTDFYPVYPFICRLLSIVFTTVGEMCCN